MVIPALIAGASALYGGIQANNTANKNRDISLLNYYQQEDAKNRAASEAARQRSESQLGSTDAAGNRTYFVPGKGWVTDLSQDQGYIQEASEDEMLRQLIQGGARNERVQGRANDRRNKEDTKATEADRELRSVRRGDEAGIRDLLLARGAETRNRSADRAGNTVARQNIRSGATNAAELLQGARAASDATSSRQAGIDAQLQARGIAQQEFDHERDSASKLYDYFRRASTSGTQAPTGVQPTGPQADIGGVQNANNALVNVLARSPQLDYQQPNYAASDTLSGIGSILSGYQGSKQGANENANIIGRWGSNIGAI